MAIKPPMTDEQFDEIAEQEAIDEGGVSIARDLLARDLIEQPRLTGEEGPDIASGRWIESPAPAHRKSHVTFTG